VRRQIRFIAVLVLASIACSVQVSKPAMIATAEPTATKQIVMTKTATPEGEWTATVRQVSVNVRSEPNGGVIGYVESGDVVTVLDCVGNWCQIEKPAGWIWRGCLSDNPARLGCQTK